MISVNVLAIDTSAKVSSVAVICQEKVLSSFSVNQGLTHSQTLMPMIEDSLKNSGMNIKEIDAFAVSQGPGSFTGLRIGIAAIKGLAYALDKPCVGVSTLEALAYNMINSNGIICATMDARCKQVYTAIFESDGKNITRLTEDMAITIDQLEEILKKYNKNIFLVGDGASLCYNNINNHNLILADNINRQQNAQSVGYIALQQLALQKQTDAGSIMPVYLRLPQAQRELLKKEEKLRNENSSRM